MKIYIENNVITKVEDNLFVQESINHAILTLITENVQNVVPTITFKRADGRILGPFILQQKNQIEFTFILDKTILRCKGELEISIGYNHYKIDEATEKPVFISRQTYANVTAVVKGSIAIPTDESEYYEEALDNLARQVEQFVGLTGSLTREDITYHELGQLKDKDGNLINPITNAVNVNLNEGKNLQEYCKETTKTIGDNKKVVDDYKLSNDKTVNDNKGLIEKNTDAINLNKVNIEKQTISIKKLQDYDTANTLAIEKVNAALDKKLSNGILDYPIATAIKDSDYILFFDGEKFIRAQKALLGTGGGSGGLDVNNRGTYDTLEEANSIVENKVINDFVYINQVDKAPILAIYDIDTGLFAISGVDYYLDKATYEAFVTAYNKDNEEFIQQLNSKMSASEFVENDLIKEEKLDLTETNAKIDSKVNAEEGKGLSDNNLTQELIDLINGAVQQVVGKVLSSNDYTNEEKEKLAGLSEIAISANKLTTPRTITANLASTTGTNFDGSANVSIGTTGTLPTSKGGTGCTSLSALSGIINDGSTDNGEGVSTKSITSSTSNYMKYKSGVMICWGRATGGSSSSGATITFPMAFADDAYSLTASPLTANTEEAAFSMKMITSSKTSSSVKIVTTWVKSNGSAYSPTVYNWIAIGRWK